MDARDLSPSAALAIECERRFQRNAHTLSRAAPHIVDLLRHTVLVVTYLKRGRDGSIACRVETADGGRRWIGGTVIPRWAAGQMLARADLPSVGPLYLAPFDGGHGLEAMLKATYQHQQIFVLERDPSLFAGTLMVTDLRGAFASGRVRFFVGPHLGEQVAAYLCQRPWQTAPEHLVTTSTVRQTVASYRDEVALVQRLLTTGRGTGPGVDRAA